VKVADTRRVHSRKTTTTKMENLTALCARGHVKSHTRSHSWNFDIRTKNKLGIRDEHFAIEILAVALEAERHLVVRGRAERACLDRSQFVQGVRPHLQEQALAFEDQLQLTPVVIAVDAQVGLDGFRIDLYGRGGGFLRPRLEEDLADLGERTALAECLTRVGPPQPVGADDRDAGGPGGANHSCDSNLSMLDARTVGARRDIAALRAQIDALETEAAGRSAATQTLQKQVAELRAHAGLTPLHGPGVEVRLANGVPGLDTGGQTRYLVNFQDVQDVVNLLFAQGAEAIAVSGRRITPLTAYSGSAGQVVIADRYQDSTLAYQGGARGVPALWPATFPHPDITFLLEGPVENGLERHVAAGKTPDRM